MGGTDKGLQMLAGRSMLAWVAQRLSPQVGELLISANDTGKYASFESRIVADEFPDGGPLAGMHAALKASRHAWLASVPCDAPFLPLDLVAHLAEAASSQQADLAVARTADGRQPVFALLQRSALPALTAYLAAGQRKADGWYAELRVAEVAFEKAGAFTNLNTPGQLREAEQALRMAAGKT
jgi:molybdopterin-guanine dinucleotide biosynthesis protein A